MAGTFQNLSGGRLQLNVVTGGESHEQRMFGDFLDKDARYARCDEFLHVVRSLWRGETVTFQGEHLQVEEAVLDQIPDPIPDIYFGGSSPAAGKVAARHADVYLTWGEPPEAVREKIDWIRKLAADEGREVRFGIRMHTITRDTAEEAWAEADRLLAGIDPAAIEKVQAGLRRSESEGQRRMLDLHQGGTDDLEIYPNVWAGVGWCAAERARRWWAATSRSPTGSRSTPRSASTSSSSPATRTWRAPTGSARACCRSWPSVVAGSTPPRLAVRRRRCRSRPVAGPGERPDRRRRRQPEARVANPRRGDLPRPGADRRRAGSRGRPGDSRTGAARLAGPIAWPRWSRRWVSADLVVVASPTYKATYTGLLKLFLDRFAGGTGLRGVAVPLMLGARAAPRARRRSCTCARC